MFLICYGQSAVCVCMCVRVSINCQSNVFMLVNARMHPCCSSISLYACVCRCCACVCVCARVCMYICLLCVLRGRNKEESVAPASIVQCQRSDSGQELTMDALPQRTITGVPLNICTIHELENLHSASMAMKQNRQLDGKKKKTESSNKTLLEL